MATVPIILRVRLEAMSNYREEMRRQVFNAGNDEARPNLEIAEYLVDEIRREIANYIRENESAIETLRRESLLS